MCANLPNSWLFTARRQREVFRQTLLSLTPTTALFNISSSSQSWRMDCFSLSTWGQCVQICRTHDSSPDGCLATAGQRSYRHRQNPPWLQLSLPLAFFQCAAAVCSLHCAVCNAQVLLAFLQTCALPPPSYCRPSNLDQVLLSRHSSSELILPWFSAPVAKPIHIQGFLLDETLNWVKWGWWLRWVKILKLFSNQSQWIQRQHLLTHSQSELSGRYIWYQSASFFTSALDKNCYWYKTQMWVYNFFGSITVQNSTVYQI